MVTGNDVPACGRMMVVAPVPPKVPIRNITNIRISRPCFGDIINHNHNAFGYISTTTITAPQMELERVHE